MLEHLDQLRKQKIQELMQHRGLFDENTPWLSKQIAYYEHLKIFFDYPYLFRSALNQKEAYHLLFSLGIEDPDEIRKIYFELLVSNETKSIYPSTYQPYIRYLEQNPTVKLNRTNYQIVEAIVRHMEEEFYHDKDHIQIGPLSIMKTSFLKVLQQLFSRTDISSLDIYPSILLAVTYHMILSKEEWSFIENNLRIVFQPLVPKEVV